MPRAPLRITRPLARTIAAPGVPSPAMRRRGVGLSWRRARGRAMDGVPSRHDVHHHWPLTVNLLFREDRTAASVPPPPSVPGVAGDDRHALRPMAILLWEQRRATVPGPGRGAAGMTRPHYEAREQATGTAMPAARRTRIAAGAAAMPRTLQGLVEQRWLRTRITRHATAEHRDGAGVPPRGAGRPIVSHRSRRAVTSASIQPSRAPRAASVSRPMRVERTLYLGDPLVHRALRRIVVTPLVRRPTPRDPVGPSDRLVAAARAPAHTTPRAVRPTRARAVDQVWHNPRIGGATQTVTQPFAPVFASSATPPPAMAFASPAAPPAPPPAPDVNRLVDEVMRRIGRQTRQDRLRRGL